MDQERKSLRVGAAVIGCAVLLRLAGSGFFQPLVDLFGSRELASFLIYMQTGKVTRAYDQPEATQVWAQESPAPEVETTAPRQIAVPQLSAADLDLISIRYSASYRPDLESLLMQSLSWDLTEGSPKVLILHTHTTESYTQTEEEVYEESSDYRTLDERYNMISIGDRLTELLENAGITVIHDRSIHDSPSYNGSYNDARESIEAYLEQYPSIELVLDIHRDAADTDAGQLSTFAAVDGQDAAQLMLVVGTDAGGLEHPNWQENLSLALKLQVVLEKNNPGICRDIALRSQRFNQDLSPGALLVEVGAAGDTHQQALTAAEALAQGIIDLANGAATADLAS